MNVASALRTDRTCTSLTGLRVREFQELAERFRWNWEASRHERKPERKRRMGGGRTGFLSPIETKLLFILFYLKSYPTFDVLSFIVGFHRTRACQWVLTLLPVLEQTLGRTQSLPERRISSVEEFLTKFPEVTDVFGDGMERRIQRPKHPRRQNKTYSGKSKTHTRKQILLADEHRRVLVLTPTKSGRRHDKRLADKSGIFTYLPPSVAAWVDTGFQGIHDQHPNTLVPRKRSRGHPLSETDKDHNRLISSFRVHVEHAIGGMKRYACLQHAYRNRRPAFDDRLSLVSAGLWNFHVSFVT